MNDKRKVLGRGLDSLLPAKNDVAAAALAPRPDDPAAYNLHIHLIDPNPYQTRKQIDPEHLKELAESIKAAGVVQPILVRHFANGRFQVIAGERRLQACKLAGKTTIPAIVRPVPDAQAMEITIIENLQREDLTPMEHAIAFDRLNREFHLTQEEIAARTGKDRASIAIFFRLLKLRIRVLDCLLSGEL
jgi:ParB family transcriptional regulator, chromosome partitioning protein